MMIPRETPLCLKHFLAYIRQSLEEDYKLEVSAKKEKEEKEDQKVTPTPSPPTRTLPRRLARNTAPIYSSPPLEKLQLQSPDKEDSGIEMKKSDEDSYSEDDSSESGSSDDDDIPITKRKRSSDGDTPYEDGKPGKKLKTSSPVVPAQKQRQINARIKVLVTQIVKITKRLESSESDCPYGFKPWICPACPSDCTPDYILLDAFDGKVAAVADMRVVECDMALRFQGEVPVNHRICWEGIEFAVDVCDGIKTLKL